MQVIYQRNMIISYSYDCYSATYGLISMKFGMLVKSHQSYFFSKFRKV